MKIAPVADVKARLSHYLEEAREGPVVVTRNGRPVAVLTALNDTDPDELERLLLAHTPRFRQLLDDAERRIRETGGIPHEQFWNAVDAEADSRAST
jgi:prevent-host-death family protein